MQLADCRHSLLDEARILLLHGLLHVLDFDHEVDAAGAAAMSAAEHSILQQLGWKVGRTIPWNSV